MLPIRGTCTLPSHGVSKNSSLLNDRAKWIGERRYWLYRADVLHMVPLELVASGPNDSGVRTVPRVVICTAVYVVRT